MAENSSDNKKLFCFGYGYSCDYIGYELLNQGGWSLSGTTRSAEKQTSLKDRDVKAHIFDYTKPLPDPYEILHDVTHLLISTPPNDDGDPAFGIHGRDFQDLPNLEWMGYLSTTGVYGNRDGAWVDETSEITPTSQRGQRRVRAEEQYLSLLRAHDLPVHIFRLSGIYGPGRSALDSVRAGVAKRIHKEGHAFGRIHVEDIAQVIIASMHNPAPGEIYNLCDDEFAPSHAVIEYACELLGRPCPPMVEFEDADLAPMTRSFYMDNRRVKNDKIKNDLGVTLKYANFREGLKACLEAEEYTLSVLNESSGGSGIFGFR